MSSLAFDTHAFVKNLTQAGMPEQQAEVLADQQKQLLDEQLATKRDIKELDVKIEALRESLESKIEIAKTELKRDIKELETSLKRDITELESKLTIKLGGMFVVGISIIAVLIKIL